MAEWQDKLAIRPCYSFLSPTRTATYDETGYITGIGYGGTGATDSVTPLLGYTYNDSEDGLDSNRISKKTYANGDREEYKYIPLSKGSRAQVEHINENGVSGGKYIYYYNENGAMTSQEYQNGNKGHVTYNYGDLSWLEEDTLTIYGLEFYLQYRQEYDILTKRLESVGISSMINCMSTDDKTLSYTYDKDGQISAFSYNAYNAEYEYDEMERLTNRVVPLLYSYENNVNESYVYKTYGNGYTTNFLTLIDDETEVNNDRTATYDTNGYITGVSYNGDAYTYTYDNVGRLAQETKNGEVVGTYTYDDKNNVQKTGLTYTNGKLTAVNGAQIVYDNLGNPTTYKGKTLVWEQGRKLTKITSSGKTVTYSYDGNGMRYEKIVNGVKTNYYWNDSELIMESKNGSRTYYIYGVTGIEGMIVEKDLEDTYYYFDKNTLGDVIAIRNEYGNVIARYSYDAWGKHTVYNANGNVDNNQSSIGNINPFRYRGYYYDTETGFYYLQTRYYDPTICRFINADNYELVADLASSMQLNMYAYCGNNPVMCIDPTGCFWEAISNWFSENWVKLTIGAGFIALGAVVAFFTAGMGTVGLAAAGSALLASAKAVGISMAISGGIGTIVGGISGGWDGALQGFASGIADGFMWGGIFSGSAQILGGASKLFASRNVNFSNNINALFGNRHSQSTTLLRVNKAGKQLFRIDADISHLWHLHYGQTSAAMRIHRTGIALYSYLGILNSLKGFFGGF